MMDFLNRFLTACICVVIPLFFVSALNAQPIELVGPKNKAAKSNKAAIYGPVKPTDTLWRIAFNHRPDPKLTIDQVMIAVFMANPHAFKNNDIHSITDGTTITIPSAKDIATISDNAAKLRIANNSQLKTSANRSAVKQPVITKTTPVVAQPAVVTQPYKQPVIEDKTLVDNAVQPKNITDNSAAQNSQLAIAMSDMQLLIKENEELRGQISALDKKLDAMQTQEALDLQAHEELAQLKEQIAAIELAKDTAHESIFNNGWVVATLASIPSVALLGGLFFWLTRRNKAVVEPEQEVKTVEPEVETEPDLEIDDDLLSEELDDDLLISDEDDDLLEISDIDDLSELDDLPDLNDDLLSSDDELLVPTDLDDVQLDDNSVVEDESDDNILAQDDLEALLAQADDLEEEEATGNPDLSDDIVSADDLDALLAQADSLEKDDSDDIMADDDIDALLDQANNAVDNDDIDALLDEANAPVADDDIDALLAEANTPVADDDIDSLLEEANAPVTDDDIDSLLEEANAPIADDDIDSLLEEANAPVADDDIDSLLEEANAPVADDDIDSLLAEANAPVADDDIDSLLAEANASVADDDIDALLEQANAPVADDDIDDLLSQTDALIEDNTDTLPNEDIDSLLNETDVLAEDDAPSIDADDVDALLNETDAIVEEDDQIDSAQMAIDHKELDDLLNDTDSLLEPEQSTVSTLEQLSQLDTIDEPYLLTEDVEDEYEKDVEFELPQEQMPPVSIDEIDNATLNEEVSTQSLAPSEEAQHLVDALDNMLKPEQSSIGGDNVTTELDEFINPQAIEIDDSELAQSMAEFDENTVIPAANSIDNSIPESTVNEHQQIDAEIELNEQLPKFKEENSFIDIDKLLDESAMNEQESEPYQNVDLDLGLDEFPDILPDPQGVDVDIDPNGASKKLDLARAYLEIDDEDSALDMLEQVKQSGDEAQIKEVEKLLKRLKS